MIRMLYRSLIKVIEVISIIGISLLVIFTAYEVFMRDLFNRPTIWTNEITSYLLVWIGMFGVVYAYDKGSHVSVDLIYKKFGKRTQDFCSVVTATLILVFSVFLTLYGYKYWWLAYSRGWRHFGMLDVPMSYTRISLPIIGLILVFQVAITIYDQIKALHSAGKAKGTAKENG